MKSVIFMERNRLSVTRWPGSRVHGGAEPP